MRMPVKNRYRLSEQQEVMMQLGDTKDGLAHLKVL